MINLLFFCKKRFVPPYRRSSYSWSGSFVRDGAAGLLSSACAAAKRRWLWAQRGSTERRGTARSSRGMCFPVAWTRFLNLWREKDFFHPSSAFFFQTLSGGLTSYKSRAEDGLSQHSVTSKAWLLDCWGDAGRMPSPGGSGCSPGEGTVSTEVQNAFDIVMVNLGVLSTRFQVCWEPLSPCLVAGKFRPCCLWHSWCGAQRASATAPVGWGLLTNALFPSFSLSILKIGHSSNPGWLTQKICEITCCSLVETSLATVSIHFWGSRALVLSPELSLMVLLKKPHLRKRWVRTVFGW